jgi:MYXO-CTERM domain-containing protein
VRVETAGDIAGDLDVGVRSGPFSGSSLASGGGDQIVELVPDVGEIGLLVSASPSVYGAYALNVTCVDAADIAPEVGGEEGGGPPNTDSPIDMIGGCAATHTASGHALPGALALMGLGLLVRRRRR